MRTSNIKLHIEELVLHGFAPGDRYTIADAVERDAPIEVSRITYAKPLSFSPCSTGDEVRHPIGGSALAPTPTLAGRTGPGSIELIPAVAGL